MRLSVMKALPTSAELDLAGARDAGTFMIELRGNPAGYSAFVKARERNWEDPLRQPIERSVEHLLSLIIRTIETGTAGSDDMRLTKAELIGFRQQGGAPNGGAGELSLEHSNPHPSP